MKAMVDLDIVNGDIDDIELSVEHRVSSDITLLFLSEMLRYVQRNLVTIIFVQA